MTRCTLFFAFVLAGCGGAAAPGPTSPAPSSLSSPVPSASTAPTAVKAPGDAKVGDKTTCPVSKDTFTVTASSPSVEHNGRTYYFCCAPCVAKFKAHPEQFLKSGS